MSDDDLQKIISQAAKHGIDESYLEKLAHAARRHARPFLTHQNVPRVHRPSQFLKRLQKRMEAAND